MAKNTKIEWCDHSWNPWIGCAKVSEGCKNCYAETLDANRFSRTLGEGTKEIPVSHWGVDAPRHVTGASNWKAPLNWNRKAKEAGERHRVFCASLSDVFEDRADLHEPRARLFDLICQTPHLDWLLLTKRPENIIPAIRMAGYNEDSQPSDRNCQLVDWLKNWSNGFPPANVWLGTSVENQKAADKRISAMMNIPAAVKFLSCEPLLDAVDVRDYLGRNVESNEGYLYDGIDWVIAGGESGPNARPMHPDWARSLRGQCEAAGVAFHFKQHGEFFPRDMWEHNPDLILPDDCDYERDSKTVILEDHTVMHRVGKKAAGRLLDGRTWDEFPKVETAAEVMPL